MPDKRCCCDHILYGYDYTQFSLIIVTCCFRKARWKRFSFYFPFTPWRRYHRFIKFDEIIHPPVLLVSFDKLLSASTSFQSESSLVTWPEYSALIRWNGFIGFCSQTTRCLSASAVKHELVMPWKWTIQALWQNVFRVQIALYVENNQLFFF